MSGFLNSFDALRKTATVISRSRRRVKLVDEALIMTLHPQIIEKEGKKEFVVIPYQEFLLIQEALDDLDDVIKDLEID